MRTRQEIEKEADLQPMGKTGFGFSDFTKAEKVTLEVLLDIRDLLTPDKIGSSWPVQVDLTVDLTEEQKENLRENA